MDTYLETSSCSREIMRDILTKNNEHAGYFGRELASESRSSAGVRLDDVMYNQKVSWE